MPAHGRLAYWGQAEVMYFPYYAYEEILATVADRPRITTSLLYAMERLTASITDNSVTAMPPSRNSDRELLLERFKTFLPEGANRPTRFFLSFASTDQRPDLVIALDDLLEREFGASSSN